MNQQSIDVDPNITRTAVPISYSNRAIPFITFLMLSVITLGLWQSQISHRRELLLKHAETSVEQLKVRIEGIMNARIASLEMIADRWIERKPPDFSRERFMGFARATTEHYPGFAGIYWISPEGLVQWVYPEEENRPAAGCELGQHPDARFRAVLSQATAADGPALTPCVELYQGGIGFFAFIPLVHEGGLQGYLGGVFKVEQLMDMSLPATMSRDFTVALFEDDRRIFQNGSGWSPNAPPGALQAMNSIEFFGKSWELQIEPTYELSRPGSGGNLTFLAFGLGLSGLLSIALFSLLQRMDMYKETRDQAIQEAAERRKAVEALRKNEMKLQELLAELGVKNAELESFAYSVSHDLKTPVVTIEGFIGALRDDFGDALPETADRYLNHMSDATRKMELLINDLLDLSRIGRLNEVKIELDFGDAALDALETLRPQIQERSIAAVVQEGLPSVYGERKRIGQVLDNLLSNAVKYIGATNPSPRIEIGCEERDGERVFFVRDNGIGIEEKYFDRIFQVFERLPPAVKIGEGTGMGLAIVKKVIESHGGRIWLESEPGRGTTFLFTLPGGDAKSHEV